MIQPEPAQVQQSVTPAAPEPESEIRILIAEDNDELRKVFLESLKKLGKIYEAKDGMEAFEIATRVQPHIIIADLDMPAMDGLALSKALKNNSQLAEIPVYLMISDMEKLQLPHSSKNEILNIIKKPVNIDSLYEVIAEKLNKLMFAPYMSTSLSERNSNILKGGAEDFSAKLEKFIIQSIPNGSLTENEIAAAMGVTTTTLHQRLRSQQGITLEDFILRSRLNYAKTLISQGVSDLGEVSRKAGFHNRDIFYSTFKKQFGFMPGTIMEK
jgi:YesN/AraC family two-component response regulator